MTQLTTYEQKSPWAQNYTKVYKFGFNGMRKDDEWGGNGNYYTTEFRQYDSRIGRWLSVDPKASSSNQISWSPYKAFFDNPIRFVDVLGSTEEERIAAAKKVREYKTQNPGDSYVHGGMGDPGGGTDCSGMVRKCVMAAGFEDPMMYTNQKGKKVQHPAIPKANGTGNWDNGVARTVSNPTWRNVPIENVRVGDVITLKTDRSPARGEHGQFDHIGMVTDVYTNENGEITGFSFVHSGGSPGSGSSGPMEGKVVLGGKTIGTLG